METKTPGTLVIQPRSGIGDMVWVISHIRAIAREVESGPIYLLTKSKAQAKTWLYNEPSIGAIEYLDKGQNVISKGLSLKSQNFKSAWIFHDSASYTVVSFLAGIPQRIGLGGSSLQNVLLTNGGLSSDQLDLHYIEQIDALLSQQGLRVRLEDQLLSIDPQASDYIQTTYGHLKKHWIMMGVGASEDAKMWPADHFIKTALLMHEITPATFFICGSASESSRIHYIVNELRQNNLEAIAINQLSISQTMALLSKADLFIGNDSGLMNVSACVGTPSIGLFGATPPLNYSPYIYAVQPSNPLLHGHEGMNAISPEQIIAYSTQMKFLNTLGQDTLATV